MEQQKTANLKTLLERARDVKMSADDKEAQRRSFAYGNANIENSRITRETVKNQAELLRSSANDK